MNTSSTLSTGTYTYVDPGAAKRELIERLIKENHISLAEGLMLMEKETVYVPQPQPFTQPSYPLKPWWEVYPYSYTRCDTNGTLHTLTN